MTTTTNAQCSNCGAEADVVVPQTDPTLAYCVPCDDEAANLRNQREFRGLE